MLTMQQKILAAIEAVAVEMKLEAVTVPAYANTGRIYYQKPGSLRSTLVLSYHFDSDYCDLGFKDSAGAAVQTFIVKYVEGGKLHDMLVFVRTYLEDQLDMAETKGLLPITPENAGKLADAIRRGIQIAKGMRELVEEYGSQPDMPDGADADYERSAGDLRDLMFEIADAAGVPADVYAYCVGCQKPLGEVDAVIGEAHDFWCGSCHTKAVENEKSL